MISVIMSGSSYQYSLTSTYSFYILNSKTQYNLVLMLAAYLYFIFTNWQTTIISGQKGAFGIFCSQMNWFYHSQQYMNKNQRRNFLFQWEFAYIPFLWVEKKSIISEAQCSTSINVKAIVPTWILVCMVLSTSSRVSTPVAWDKRSS